MGYVPENPDDRREHDRYHDTVVNGVLARGAKSDRIIWERDDFRITVVDSSSSPAQKKRAERIAGVCNSETRYTFGVYDACEPMCECDTHLFLLYHQSRLIGILKMEKKSTIWRDDREGITELLRHPPVWSVVLVYVHKKHRRQGLASSLLGEALRFFGISMQEVGWYTPFTDLGEEFVNRHCPDWYLIAK